MIDRNELIEVVTRQVLATLAADERLPEERKPQYETRARAMVRRLHQVPDHP